MVRLALSTAIVALAFAGTSIYFSRFSKPGLLEQNLSREQQDLRKAIDTLRAEGTKLQEVQKSQALASRRVPRSTATAEASQAKPVEAALKVAEGGAPGAESGKATPAARRRETLLHRFSELDGYARREAFEEIAKLALEDDQAAMNVVIAALKDPDASIREEAVRAIGDTGDPEQLPKLEEAMKDASPSVRDEVAGALGKNMAENVNPLLMQLLNDPSGEVVGEAIQQLWSRKYTEALPQIYRLAVQSEDLHVVAEAGVAFRKFGDNRAADQVLERLAAGLESKHSRERATAVRRIARVGGATSVPYLEKALKDESPYVREKAQEALSRKG